MAKRALAGASGGGGDKKPQKLWGGAFGEATDPMMEVFNNSLPFDKKLWAADIRGSKAYAKQLHVCGVLDDAQAADMQTGLDATRAEWASGGFVVVDGDEDIHTANERRLGEHVGTDTAGRLHTGRSRNDQVATDLKLWLRAEVRDLRNDLRALIESARASAAKDESVDALLPGYTHLQRAQPIRWSHWTLAHAWAWTRDAPPRRAVAAERRLPARIRRARGPPLLRGVGPRRARGCARVPGRRDAQLARRGQRPR